VKYLGPSHGILLAAAAGGLISSTAVTVTNARRAAVGEAPHRLLAAGVAAATAVSFFRVFAIVAVLQPRLLALVGPALLGAALAAVGFAAIAAFRSAAGDQIQPELKFQNPFGFLNVVGFAIVLAAIIVLGRAVGETFGAAGAVSGAILIGLADVDAVTVSITHLTPSPLTMWQGAQAILAATASNTLAKAAIGAAIGGGRFAAGIAALALACMIAAALVFGLTIALLPG